MPVRGRAGTGVSGAGSTRSRSTRTAPPTGRYNLLSQAQKDFISIIERASKNALRRPARGNPHCFPNIHDEDIDNLGEIALHFQQLLAKTTRQPKNAKIEDFFKAINVFFNDMQFKVNNGFMPSGLMLEFARQFKDVRDWYEVLEFNPTDFPGVNVKEYIRARIDAGEYDVAWEALNLAVSNIARILIPALELDSGLRRVPRAPEPPHGGRLEVEDPPEARSTVEYNKRGTKIGLKGIVETSRDAFVNDAGKLKTKFEAKYVKNRSKAAATNPGRWTPQQNARNLEYLQQVSAPDLQFAVNAAGKVEATVREDVANPASARQVLYTVTPYNPTSKKIIIDCHPSTGFYGAMRLDTGYYGTIQARDNITDAVRTICKDPKFASAAAIVIRVSLTDDSRPDKPYKAPTPGSDDDAYKLLSWIFVAMNAEPRVVPKLAKAEYDFLKRSAIPDVVNFMAFYDRHNAHSKTTSSPVHKFTHAEMQAFRNEYEDSYLTKANTVRENQDIADKVARSPRPRPPAPPI
jgi:hypothetical protein